MTLSSTRTGESVRALDDLRRRVAALPLVDKVALLTGDSAWRLRALPELGLRPIAMSDGPAGVRGTGEVPGETSILFPAPSAVSATWDVGVATALGAAFAREARDHGVDVVLAPQVNIQRTPVAGRHFECYSEDPYLTSVIGTGVVGGLQASGVAACVKHYIANDSETERTSYVARPGARAMREIYLAPFEHAVGHGVWSVMAAYNQVDDGAEIAQMTAHRGLVVDLLKTELGFDGVVVSDWMATKDAVPSALGGLDLVMPGPGGPWDEELLAAVEAGAVPATDIDDKVARILLLGSRVGAFGEPAAEPAETGDLRTLARDIAARSTVVLRREGTAPWDRPAPESIALIGPNAVRPHVMGGGSSVVHPAHLVSPEEGLRARFPEARLSVARGGDPRRLAPELELGPEGIAIDYLAADGRVLARERRDGWDGWIRDIADGVDRVALRLEIVLAEPGIHYLEVGTVGGHRIAIGGEPVSEDDAETGAEVILNSTINNPEGWGRAIEVLDTPRRVAIETEHRVTRAGGYGAIVRAALRHRRPQPGDDAEIAEAVAAASRSDLAVVIVGTNEEVESEGWDRTGLGLPGRQDELVEAVLDVAPDAVIVVNAGAPVVLPWLKRARTVLWTWFPGQEGGHALAAVLAGDLEPAGRLPWTLPAAEADVPVPSAIPVGGVVDYSDGIHVGYRAWLQPGRPEPAAEFGFGLGWSTWDYQEVAAEWTPEGDLLLAVALSNAGDRAAREVVQAYLEPPDAPGPERPARWLAGFASIELAAGERGTAALTIPRRQFEVWDADHGRWILPPGSYPVRIGRSVRELRLDTAVRPDSSGWDRKE